MNGSESGDTVSFPIVVELDLRKVLWLVDVAGVRTGKQLPPLPTWRFVTVQWRGR